MSKKTYQAVEEAIQAHMADENDGALLNHWLVIAHGVSATETAYSHYQYMNHDGPPHEWLGLLKMANRRLKNWTAEDEVD